MLVARLAADHGRPPDQPLLHLGVGVSVRLVEAPGEAAHDLEVWPLAGLGDDLFALAGGITAG